MSKLLAQVDFNTKSLPRLYYCRHRHVTSLALLPLPSTLSFQFQPLKLGRSQSRSRRDMASPTSALLVFSQNPVVGDVVATALTGAIALSSLRVWEETARRGLFDQVILKCLFVCLLIGTLSLFILYFPFIRFFVGLQILLSVLDFFNLSVWFFLTYSSAYATLQKIAQKNIQEVFFLGIFWGFFLLETSIFTPDRG